MPADDADIGVGLGGAKINESGNNDCDLLGRRLGNHALPVVARGGAEAGQFRAGRAAAALRKDTAQ